MKIAGWCLLSIWGLTSCAPKLTTYKSAEFKLLPGQSVYLESYRRIVDSTMRVVNTRNVHQALKSHPRGVELAVLLEEEETLKEALQQQGFKLVSKPSAADIRLQFDHFLGNRKKQAFGAVHLNLVDKRTNDQALMVWIEQLKKKVKLNQRDYIDGFKALNQKPDFYFSPKQKNRSDFSHLATFGAHSYGVFYQIGSGGFNDANIPLEKNYFGNLSPMGVGLQYHYWGQSQAAVGLKVSYGFAEIGPNTVSIRVDSNVQEMRFQDRVETYQIAPTFSVYGAFASQLWFSQIDISPGLNYTTNKAVRDGVEIQYEKVGFGLEMEASLLRRVGAHYLLGFGTFMRIQSSDQLRVNGKAAQFSERIDYTMIGLRLLLRRSAANLKVL